MIVFNSSREEEAKLVLSETDSDLKIIFNSLSHKSSENQSVCSNTSGHQKKKRCVEKGASRQEFALVQHAHFRLSFY